MKNPNKRGSLPQPNVEYVRSGTEQITPKEMRSLICNPIYAGLGPFPQLIDDEMWVRAAAQMIKNEGSEQFLVNMLFVLRQAMDAPEDSNEGD